MDDGYPPEETPSMECQTLGQRQAEHNPGSHGLKICFEEHEINREGRMDLNLEGKDGRGKSEMDNSLFKYSFVLVGLS